MPASYGRARPVRVIPRSHSRATAVAAAAVRVLLARGRRDLVGAVPGTLESWLALRGLPISEYPEVAPPSVVVRAQYPGANPKVIAETVATPLEEQLNGIEGLLYMNSLATADGAMTLTISFKIGTNPEVAETAVQPIPIGG